MRVLVVESEKSLALLFRRVLASHHVVDVASTGEKGLFMAFAQEYGVIIIKNNLPDLSGYEMCRDLRQNQVAAPILILTGSNDSESRVMLLNAGADDCLNIPCNWSELRARIGALLRRQPRTLAPTLQAAELQLNPFSRSVLYQGRPLRLARKEFLILEYLLRHPGEVISRYELLEHIWEQDAQALTSNTIDVHINNLRNKIGKPASLHRIKTIHGSGYMLNTTQS